MEETGREGVEEKSGGRVGGLKQGGGKYERRRERGWIMGGRMGGRMNAGCIIEGREGVRRVSVMRQGTKGGR